MTTLSPGEQIGPYQIIAQAGQGGMAVVYKAYHAAMDRHVAIKILPFQFAENPDFLQRFQREVRTIAKLEHARILPVYDSGEHRGTPYLVMRYLDSGSLKNWLKSGALGLQEIDRIFTQLADALGYAHQHGVIHRDIKPANILLTQTGDIFLTDFGIAKLLGETSALTQSGGITGTPIYMSPEQAQGEPLDARSDIYSLGILLYEMTTGRVPFEAETPLAIILKHLQAPLPPPTSLNPNLDPEIEKVLLKALAKNRDDRFQTTAEFSAAWTRALQAANASAANFFEEHDNRADTIAHREPEKTAAVKAVAQEPGKGTATVATARPPLRRKWVYWAAAGVLAFILILWGGGQVLRVCCVAPNLPVGAAPTGEGVAPRGKAGYQWDVFVGTNTIYSLAWHDGLLYAAGEGGIAIWNTQDMSLVQQLMYRDGLPGTEIYTLLLDDKGTLWAGGNDGFAWFDGTAWVQFGEEDGLDAGYVTALEQGANGMLVGTSYGYDPGDGLMLFDGVELAPFPGWVTNTEEEDAFSPDVNDIFYSRAAGLWVATDDGAGFFDGSSWSRFTTANGLPSNDISSILQDDAGHFYIAASGGTSLWDPSTGTATPLDFIDTSGMQQMVQALDGLVWFVGEDGTWRYDPASGRATNFGKGNGVLPVYELTSVALGEGGHMYIGSELGIFAYDGTRFSQYLIPNLPRQSRSEWIVPAPDGTILFNKEEGDYSDVYNPADGTWSLMPELPCCHEPVVYDAAGNLWAGGSTGLWIVTARGDIHLTTEQGLPSDEVHPISFDADGRAWVGTEGGLAVIEDFTVTEIFTGPDMGSESGEITAVLAASDGSIWVAVEDEDVYRRAPDGSWERFNYGHPFTDNMDGANTLAEDISGHIWVGTSGDGVWRYSETGWEHFQPTDPGVLLPSFEVNFIHAAMDGSVWFATDKGAARFDGEAWEAFTVADGLLHPWVNAIYVDASGAVWFATSGGITRLTPDG